MSTEQQQHRNGAFRAPPPSPIATGQGIKSAGVNNEILSEFLEQTLRIPELNLPEPLIPYQDLPAFDVLCLRSPDDRRSAGRRLVQSSTRFGCFQLINHGISPELRDRAKDQCRRLFDLPSETKRMICRSEESRFGFEHIAGDGVDDKSRETFWVDRDDDFIEKSMRNVWPEGFRNFSWAMSEYSAALEKVASEVLEILYENLNLDSSTLKELLGEQNSSVLCLYSDGASVGMINGDSHSHSRVMSVHQHEHEEDKKGSSAFSVYADGGWTTFNLIPDSLVITLGNILEVWSNGVLKSVKGRAVCSTYSADYDMHFISMEFLYSPSFNICRYRSIGKLVKVSLLDQFLVAILVILLWNIYFYLRGGG